MLYIEQRMVQTPTCMASVLPSIPARSRTLTGAILRFRRERSGDFLQRVAFENIVDAEIAERAQADTALVSCRHLADVILEPAERVDFRFVNETVIPHDTNVHAAHDTSVVHVTPRDDSHTRNAEQLANGRPADDLFLHPHAESRAIRDEMALRMSFTRL